MQKKPTNLNALNFADFKQRKEQKLWIIDKRTHLNDETSKK